MIVTEIVVSVMTIGRIEIDPQFMKEKVIVVDAGHCREYNHSFWA